MPSTEKVRALNDQFRTTMQGGRVVATPGVMALNDLHTILTAVREFSDFSEGHDPHREHDFGAIRHGEHQLFWKIDYYDHDLLMGSPDPADTAVTARVLTVMLAEEY